MNPKIFVYEITARSENSHETYVLSHCKSKAEAEADLALCREKIPNKNWRLFIYRKAVAAPREMRKAVRAEKHEFMHRSFCPSCWGDFDSYGQCHCLGKADGTYA